MRWILVSVFMVFASGMIYLSVNSYLSGNDNSLFSATTLFVLILLSWTIYSFFTTAVTTTVINRRNRTLTVKKKGLLKNFFRTYQFDDINGGFVTIKETWGHGTYYTIELPLKNDENIELAVPRMLNRKQYIGVVEDVNKYLSYGSDTFKLTILNVD